MLLSWLWVYAASLPKRLDTPMDVSQFLNAIRYRNVGFLIYRYIPATWHADTLNVTDYLKNHKIKRARWIHIKIALPSVKF